MFKLNNATEFVAPSGQVFLTGQVDPGCLDDVVSRPYQREELPVSEVEAWVEAYFAGRVPHLYFGTHSQKVRSTKSGISVPSVNIIDGLQRKFAAQVIRDQGEEVLVLGVLYLGTTEEWEIERFRELNSNRRKVNPNILLRNARYRNPALAELYDYTVTRPNTLLSGRVQWGQGAKAGNLFPAGALLRVASRLHGHFGRGLGDTDMRRLSWALADVTEDISTNTLVANVETFFRVITRAAKIDQLTKPKGVVQLKLGYMLSLAQLLAQYSNFWVGERLVIKEEVAERLVRFKLDQLRADNVSSRGRVTGGLIDLLAAEAKKGGERNRLIPWQ